MRFTTGVDRRGPLVWLSSKFTFDGPHWYAVWRDVSDAKKAERSMHDWLATTSHDARTPISSIKVSCALLEEQPLCAEAHELAMSVQGSARVLLGIVNHVRFLKRLDAGEGNVAAGLAPLCVRELAQDLAAVARVGLVQQQGLSIILEFDKSLPEQLMCHAAYLEHLLLSLLVYCVQTSGGAGGADGVRTIRVAVAWERAARLQQQHCLVLCVTAEARVLSAEQAAALFDPYTACGHDERHDAGGGSGRLGLLVARRLAVAMGGSLAAHSCAAVGSRFVATIPAASLDAAHATDAAELTPRFARCSCQSDSGAVPMSPAQMSSAGAAELLQADLGILDILEHCGVGDTADRHERYEEKKQRGELRQMLDLLLVNSAEGFIVKQGAGDAALRMRAACCILPHTQRICKQGPNTSTCRLASCA